MPWHESVVRAREALSGRLYLLHPVMQRILRLWEGFKDMLILDMSGIRLGCVCAHTVCVMHVHAYLVRTYVHGTMLLFQFLLVPRSKGAIDLEHFRNVAQLDAEKAEEKLMQR